MLAVIKGKKQHNKHRNYCWLTSVGEMLTFLVLPYVFRSGLLTMLMLGCQQNPPSESGVRFPGPVPLTDAVAIRICLDPLCVRTFQRVPDTPLRQNNNCVSCPGRSPRAYAENAFHCFPLDAWPNSSGCEQDALEACSAPYLLYSNCLSVHVCMRIVGADM